jgi:hypothetical protein
MDDRVDLVIVRGLCKTGPSTSEYRRARSHNNTYNKDTKSDFII